MKSVSAAKRRGFTLIELLVVIAIIGVLASTVLASMQSARIAARDARRVSDLRQLQTAFELFRNANGGAYPCSTGNWIYGANQVTLLDGTAQTGSATNLNRPAGCSDIRPYIDVPTNTVFTSPTDNYLYRSVPPTNGTNYVLRVRMEGSRYGTGGGYCIVNPGNLVLSAPFDTYPSCY